MRKQTAKFLWLSAAVTLLVSPAVMAKERTPEGSFLRFRANTVSELKNQVNQDPVAQARYVRHFGTSTRDVMRSMGTGTKLITTKRPMKVQMWYVGRDGTLKMKTKLLPKGSSVFASKDGIPFLAWSCGNPLRASLPTGEAIAKADHKKALVASAKLPDSMVKGTLEEISTATTEPGETLAAAVETPNTDLIETKTMPAVEVIAAAAITAPPTLIAPAVAVAQPVELAPTLVAAATPATGAIAPILSSGGGGSIFGWLGGLAGLAGGVAALGGGGGGGTTPLAPVPEPSTLLVLGTALSSMGLVSVKKYLRRH